MSLLEVDIIDEKLQSDNLLIAGFKQNILLCFNGSCIWAISDFSSIGKSRELDHKTTVGRKIKLGLSHVPPYESHSIEINKSGSKICLFGEKFAAVIQMPQDFWISPKIDLDSLQDHYIARCEILDSKLFAHSESKILEVKWHPGSDTDSHLVILTKDNLLRFYDVSDPENYHQMRKMDLNLSFDNTVLLSKESARFGLLNSAISFDFGHHNAIFLLTKEMDIYAVDANIEYSLNLDSDCVSGPLLMSGYSVDSYGFLDARDLILLNRTSGIPILVILTSNGFLLHCIVLGNPKDPDSDECSQELYMYDTVELDLGISHIDLATGKQKINNHRSISDIRLVTDDSNPYGYFVVWPEGVYSVDISNWARGLETDQNELTNNQSVVSYRFSNELFDQKDDHNSQITSVAVLKSNDIKIGDSYFFVALSSGEIFLDLIESNSSRKPAPSLNDSTIFGSGSKKKSQRKMLAEGGTLEEVQRILTTQQNMPVLRPKQNLAEKDCAEVVLRAMQILKEKLEKQNRAKQFLNKRSVVLLKQREEQRCQLLDFDRRCKLAIDFIINTKQKLQISERKHEKLADRLQKVLNQLNNRKGALSLAEEEQLGQLTRIHENLKNMQTDIKQMSKTVAEFKDADRSDRKSMRNVTPRKLALEKSQENVEKLCDSLSEMKSEMEWIQDCLEE